MQWYGEVINNCFITKLLLIYLMNELFKIRCI